MNSIKFRNFRGLNKTIGLVGIISLFIQIFLFQCADRNRTNIFDPSSGIDSLDIILYITTADSVITVRWTPPAIVQYTGYNLYRKTNNQGEFQLIAALPPGQTEFMDVNVSYDINYQYYIKIQGEESESPPSRILKVTPGPVAFYMLDRWNYSIYKLSYDLEQILFTRYTNWSPENLAFDSSEDLVLVTYPQLSYFEIFSRKTGLTELSSTKLAKPYDGIYNSEQSNFWITDSSGYLYSINPVTGTSKIIDQNLDQPTQIRQSKLGIFVMDTKGALINQYDYSGVLLNTVKKMGTTYLVQPISFSVKDNSANIYIIDRINDENRILYQYSILTDSVKIVCQKNFMNIVRTDPQDNSIWIAINNSNNDSLMQLSPDGIRLNEVTGFSGITDFILIRESNTIAVTDYVQHNVKHIRKDASVIGVFEEAIYPSKVYSE